MAAVYQTNASLLHGSNDRIGLRVENGELERSSLSPEVEAIFSSVREEFPPLIEDRALDLTLRHFVARMQRRDWKFELSKERST